MSFNWLVSFSFWVCSRLVANFRRRCCYFQPLWVAAVASFCKHDGADTSASMGALQRHPREHPGRFCVTMLRIMETSRGPVVGSRLCHAPPVGRLADCRRRRLPRLFSQRHRLAATMSGGSAAIVAATAGRKASIIMAVRPWLRERI